VAVDVRIIAATNRNLEPMIAAGQFREDLYYRLNVVPITLPSLRERADDVPALARHFLRAAAGEGLPFHQLADEAAELLSRQPWRGNVRELRNFIYRLALLAREDIINVASIEPLLREAEPIANTDTGDGIDAAVAQWWHAVRPGEGLVYDAALAAFERPLFIHALYETNGNQLQAARLLGINRNTLRKRLTELAIDPGLIQR
jgi:two-component system nitrogen regulation response regulator GlnG